MVEKGLFMAIILSGVLPWAAGYLSQLNTLAAGLLFFSMVGLISTLPDLPFDYYHSFVIEARHGFNTKTIRIWLSDLAKSFLLAVILGGALIFSLLLMLEHAGATWWLWAWGVFLLFQVLVAFIYPTLIAPLFNKFTPIEDTTLKTEIEKMAEREGLSLKGIYQMDASKRSRHTNAYFSGLGKSKRIVLFDSLMGSHTTDEIVAVLAHEVGHLKKNHIIKQIAFTGVFSLLLFFLASKMIVWPVMYASFGFPTISPYIGLFLVGVLWEPVGFFLAPIGMAISRRFEREADLHCLSFLKDSAPFLVALKRLAKENLANLRPHPLYVWFNYSHPPLIERIGYIESKDPAKS
jgi:STE24 endopeptidase